MASDTTQRVRIVRGLAPTTRGAGMVVIHGQRLGQCIDLHDVPVVIGRAPNCDFQIEHRSVSRAHCKVWHDEGTFLVRDLGSTNHTYVNQRVVEQAELRDGDHVAIGETVFKFVLRGSLEARYHEALYQLASIDSLTGLYNRRKFGEFLEHAVARAQTEQRKLALMFVDLDHFKAINDRCGHMVGDEVLRSVGAALLRDLRANDTGGRLGGEEFGILMPDTTLVEAMERAESVRQTLFATRCEAAGQEHRVTASIGVVALVAEMATVSDLMRDADTQLFRAKAAGRNRVCAPGR